MSRLRFFLQAKPSWRSRRSRSRLLLSSQAACGWALVAVPFSPSHCPSVRIHFNRLLSYFSQQTLSFVNCIVVHLQHQRQSRFHTALLHQHSFATMDTDKLSGSSLLHLVRVESFQRALKTSKYWCIDLKNCIIFLRFTGCLITSPGSSTVTTSQLILSGGEGYINFRIGEYK